MTRADITADVVRELLDYDPATKELTWRERDREWFVSDNSWKLWNARFAEKPALAHRSRWHRYRQGTLLGVGVVAEHIAALGWPDEVRP